MKDENTIQSHPQSPRLPLGEPSTNDRHYNNVGRNERLNWEIGLKNDE